MDKLDRAGQRLKNLLCDIEAIKRACSEDENCPFKEFEYNDYLFRFECHSNNEKRYFWANLSEDYPHGTVLTWTVNGSEQHSMKQYDLALPFVFNMIARELYKEISIPVVCQSRCLTSETDASAEGDDDSYDDDDDEDNDDDGCNYDDYDERFVVNYNNGCGGDKSISLLDDLEIMSQCDQELREDFEALQCFCEEAQMHEIRELDEVEIGLYISTDFLEDELARAWRLIPKEPIVVRMFFSYTKYCEEFGASKVEVFQEKRGSEKITVGVLVQLQSILTTFIKKFVLERALLPAQHASKSKNNRKIPDQQTMSSPKQKVPRLSSSVTVLSDPKVAPSHGYGLLVDIFGYAQQRLHTLNDYCVICDELHPYTNSAMLKPMVCDRPLCVFSYQTLGVMAAVADDIAVETKVVDLLLAMAKAACLSPRGDAIFDPYPTVVNPDKPMELAFTPADKTTMAQVQKVMSKFVPMEEMTKVGGVELKTQLDTKDKLIFPLMQWIISSNRSHIVSLKQEQRLSFIDTPHQFLLRCSPPAKEAAFNAAKQIYGSVFAFHGSPIENWHSILRRGLLNASGSKLQMHGAAHGKGIYLSPDAALSISYCLLMSRTIMRVMPKYPVPNTWSMPTPASSSSKSPMPESESSLHLLPPQNVICIALCEVINSKSLKKSCTSIWVMPDEDYVVTRFLFVYEDSGKAKLKVRSDSAPVLAELRKAIQG